MTTATPLLDRINARRKVGRIGPVSPLPITDKMSPFQRRLLEKQLPVKEFLHDLGPDGTPAA